MEISRDSKPNVLFVTTGRINPNGDLYYPPLVANQIDSLQPFLSGRSLTIIHSLNPFIIVSKIIEVLRKRKQADLVHAQYGSLTAFIAYLGKGNKPLVISFGGSDLLGAAGAGWKWKLRNWITRQMSLWAANGCDSVIVKSQTLLNSLPLGLHKKATVIPNGVDIQVFCPNNKQEAKKRLGWSENIYYVLFTPSRANNVLVKNLPLAKEVIRLVNERMGPASMEFILDKTPGQVADMMNAADCLLLTSLHEGSPNVIKEAMACNLPIVTVHVGDVMERLWSVKNAFVVDSYSPELLSARVEQVLIANQRTNGTDELSRQQITATDVAARILNIYNKVLKC